MKYYGTKNNKDYGFYKEKFENSIEITDDYWKELLNKQSNGKIIILFENNVIAVDKTEYSFVDNKWIKLPQEKILTNQLTIKNAIKKQELQEKISELDKKRIRAIAEPSLKDENTTWLEFYNNQIIALRKEISELK